MNQTTTSSGFVSLQKVDIKNLEPYLTSVVVVGIIIGKQKPKIFQAEGNKERRAVWSFTIRDSLQHYINVSYWGSPEVIYQACDRFSTGNVVEIVNPQIKVRKPEDAAERFYPMVTSPYRLELNDNSTINIHLRDEAYKNLLEIPTKPTAVFMPIHDIQTFGSSIQCADILAAVKGLREVRTVKTKSNEVLHVREIEVFDHTAPSLKISLWDPDIISRSNSWRPRSTILFLTDVRISWSDFQKSYTANTTARTIVTVNPISKEAVTLFEYAQTAPIETFDIVDRFIASLPTSSAMDETLNIKRVHERINNYIEHKQGSTSFNVVLYAFISEMDLDGLSRTLLIKCSRCKMTISNATCENTGCSVVYDNGLAEPEYSFDIRLTLSDHTGTLVNARLCGNTAEAVLGATAKQFASMSDEDKCILKWQHLLEQRKIRIAVLFALSSRPIISVLGIENLTRR